MTWNPGKEMRETRDGPLGRSCQGVSAVDLMVSDLENSASGARNGRGGQLRIALYSHDTVGFGHLRRNLRIARSLNSEMDPASILLITGAAESGYFSMPEGVDCLTLPALRKDASGRYGSRSLGVSLDQLIRLRSSLLRAGLESFEPDILIVDKVPRGAMGELDDALEMLRCRGRTRCVLGLREVLDDPLTVRREWHLQRMQQSLDEYYDAVWIYGDRSVYDPISEYGLTPAPNVKVHYTGYLDPGRPGPSLADSSDRLLRHLSLPEGRIALCVVGGGEDGGALATAFIRAKLPPDMIGVIVTGPLMPAATREQLQRSVAKQDCFRVLEFITDPEPLMHAADRVISMGGYNTVCEILGLEKQCLIVPRVEPRREQLIRAERLRDLQLVDMLPPDQLGPESLTEWLWKELPVRPPPREQIDFGGLGRLPHLIAELTGTARGSSQTYEFREDTIDART